MIKEKTVLIKVNNRNKQKYIDLGYEITGDELLIKPEHLSKGSKIRVTAICANCDSENDISYNKYLVNFNRNDKGYYSCFDCKYIIFEDTCMKRYGVKSVTQLEETKDKVKKTNNERYGGNAPISSDKVRKKMEETNLERYGYKSYFSTDESKEYNRKWMSSDEFREKSKKTMIEKYGVDHYSKTQMYKDNMDKESMVKNIKTTFMEKYGVEWYSKTDEWKSRYNEKLDETREKIKNTCLERYGVDNVSKVKEIKEKSRQTLIEGGYIIPDEMLSDWELYKRKSVNLFNKAKIELFESWDGYDFYDGEYILEYLDLEHTDPKYPCVDHKVSVYHGFMNDIPVEEINDLDNLCFTKRSINSSKGKKTEDEFKSE